jgi:hypothetical protein
MQILTGRLLLSATALVNFLGCRHATYLDLRDLTGPGEIPERDAATVLIFQKGIELVLHVLELATDADAEMVRRHFQDTSYPFDFRYRRIPMR